MSSQQQAKSSPSTPTQQQKPQGEKQFKPRGDRPQNKDGNQERKPFRGGRGGSRGGARSGNNNNNNLKRNTQKKDSKTVFVGRVFFDDLYSQNISTSLADKLKDQRVRILKDIFTQFGEIEAIEAHLDGDDNNYMLVTYITRDSAKEALQTFKSKDLLNAEVDKVKAKLSQQKQFPPNVCPELYKYRFDWSDKPAQNAKSAAVQNKNNKNYPKTVVAGTGTQQAQTASTSNTDKPKKEKKPKKEQKQQEQPATPAVQPPQQQEEKKPQQQPKKEQTKAPKKQQGSGDLQREAEKAKLKEELKYLQNQQSHVSSELQAEKIRAKERDERIVRLSAELQRVREEEQVLQNKLNAENTYRADGEARIHKLREELSHMHQEEQIVSQKMSLFEQQETAQQNGTY